VRAPRLQAAIVIATATGLPLLDRLTRVLTRDPLVEEVDLDGVRATVCRPPGRGPWPAVVVLNGATPLGNRHRAVLRLAGGLARAGYLVVLPELPGLEAGEIDAGTAEATPVVTAAVAARLGARDGRVALLGVSTGAGLALLAAADERLRGRVSVVVAVAPFADLRLVVRLATTGVYVRDGELRPYRTVPLLGRVVARSLAAALPRGSDRELLLGWLPRSGEQRDPLGPLPSALLARLGPEGRAVAALLANRDPGRFDQLFEALPTSVLELVELLSPGKRELEIDTEVELVTSPDDGYFPLGEAEQLAAALPGSRLTVTSALEHVVLRPTLNGARDLLRLGGATVRALRAASAANERASQAAEPLRFLLVGAGGFGVNALAFALLYGSGAAYVAASIAAYLVSNALMYLGNRYFTFRLGHEGLLSGYARYAVVGLFVATLSVAMLAGLVEGGGIDPRLAQALSLLGLTPIAFLVNKRWTFGSTVPSSAHRCELPEPAPPRPGVYFVGFRESVRGQLSRRIARRDRLPATLETG
jgi:putative flippase GtrA/pimeloyl-ACP methyl ester carboxylesterase